MLSSQVRVGNLTFDGVDSQMLHLGDVDGDLGEALRCLPLKNKSTINNKFILIYLPVVLFRGTGSGGSMAETDLMCQMDFLRFSLDKMI